MTAPLDSIFNVEYGNKLDMNKMKQADPLSGVAFVGRKGGLEGHAGISGYVIPPAGIRPFPAGLLTVALGGSRLLSTYVQQRPFITAQNVAVLTPRSGDMSLKSRLFYAMCIRHNAFRYAAFGREANRTVGLIEVPTAIPDWVEEAELPSHEGLAEAIDSPVELSGYAEWHRFRLRQLFEITRGKYFPAAEQFAGSTAVVTASREHNGVSKYLDVKPRYSGGQLTVSRNGSVGEAFYQEDPFYATDDVFVLDPIDFELTPFRALFLTTVIRAERYRYSYGRKLRIPLLQDTVVRLPVRDGLPDWEYMETVMRGLPFSAVLSENR